MRDPLNFFEPYESLPPTHENQLTRGFLVVLGLVPLAHAVWLRMVSDARGRDYESLPPLEQLPAAKFETQTGAIGPTTVAEEGLDETSAYRAVSVLQAGQLTPDESPAGTSFRRAVFDGIVRYGDDLALIIESKLDGRFDERQAREITIGETAWRVDLRRVRLQWRDIISAWRDLLVRDLVTGAERKILEDFMWFVQRNFSRLQPFSDFPSCRGNPYLLRLRCKAILDEVGPSATERRYAAGLLLEGARGVRLAYLGSDDAESTVWLRLFPGDTLAQAKILYSDAGRIERLLGLRDQGWTIKPNFHFGHMAKGLVWTTGDIGEDEYVSYWLQQIGGVGQVRREEWKQYFDQLVELRIAAEADRQSFDHDFTGTERASATPRPGLRLEKVWPFESAAEVDRRHRFAGEVRTSINGVLRTIGEPELPGS